MPRTLAVALLLAACDAPAAAVTAAPDGPGLPRPEDPFVHADACLGGCCSFGLWTASEPVDIVDAVGGTNVVVHLDAGATVLADSGELHVRPVETTVTHDRPMRRPSSRDRTAPYVDLHPGDRVTLLSGMGGGYRLLWANGHYYTDKAAFLEPGACPAAGAVECWAEPVAPPEETWWVQMRTPDGKKGWARGSSFSGWNRCG